ncbi:hypothetical protein AB6A40_005189 [Gnathostoma spinigerum]|uniref:Uncharacterized protein n=1 Tax=Gnathostoma spinigerum TaxID=75299 RepID=A0ABD6EQE3_9BILA
MDGELVDSDHFEECVVHNTRIQQRRQLIGTNRYTINGERLTAIWAIVFHVDVACKISITNVCSSFV